MAYPQHIRLLLQLMKQNNIKNNSLKKIHRNSAILGQNQAVWEYAAVITKLTIIKPQTAKSKGNVNMICITNTTLVH